MQGGVGIVIVTFSIDVGKNLSSGVNLDLASLVFASVIMSTVADPALAVVTLAVAPGVVGEDGASNLVYTFTRTGPTTNALTVYYTVDGNTATGNTANGNTRSVTFAAGAAIVTVIADPADDHSTESNETIVVNLAPGSGYTVGTDTLVTGAISNDDLPVVFLSVSPSSVAEDGASSLIYSFSRTGPTDGPLLVTFSLVGDATPYSDYQRPPEALFFSETIGQISLPPGVSSKTLTIDPILDSIIEKSELVSLMLLGSSEYLVGTTAAPVSGYIVNDDFPLVSLSISTSSIAEDGAPNLIYGFSRTGATDAPLSVSFSVGGSAIFGLPNGDYAQSGAASFSATEGLVTFPVGSATVALVIDPFIDATPEGNETVALALASGDDYRIAATAAVIGTIRNDDPQVGVTVSPSSLLESSGQSFVYTFSRNRAATTDLVVNYSIAGGAVSSDYKGATPGSGRSITIPSGSISASLVVTPINDNSVESNESIDVILASGAGYFVGPEKLARAVIANDDFASIGVGWDNRDPANAFKLEGDTDGAVLSFRLTRSGDLSEVASVDWAVVGMGLNPVDANDFEGGVLPSGRVVFKAGEDNVLIELHVAADREIEANEAFVIQLSNASGNGIITTDKSRGAIQDDDFLDPESSFTQTGSESAQISGSLVYDFSVRLATDPITAQVDEQFSALQQTDALFHNLVGLYRVVNSTGAIVDSFDSNGDGSREDLLKPGDAGYASTAIANRIDNFELQLGDQGAAGSNTTADQFGDVLLNAGVRYAPFVIANGGRLIPRGGNLEQGFEAFLATNPSNQAATLANFSSHAVAYFGFAAANPDGSNHLASRGGGAYGFEDLPGNLAISDFDFNDASFQFRFL